MIRHNLRLAFRQLEKYRLQSLVSVVSLAIGFACFALASMWIKYETTYDAFHKDADRIHILMFYQEVYSENIKEESLAQFPEVEQVSVVQLDRRGYRTNGGSITYPIEYKLHDTSFLDIFDIQFLEGSQSFLHDTREVAVSEEFAHMMWGEESPLGKELKDEEFDKDAPGRIVTAVFKGWGSHTSFPFHVLSCMPDRFHTFLSTRTFMKLSEHTDLVSLNERIDTTKLFTYDNHGKEHARIAFSRDDYNIVPITEARHATASYKNNAHIRVNHVYLFAIAGGMLILCAMLNYLTMFINRLFIRKREIALRTVYGASGRDLTMQFLVEYGLLLLFAMFLAFMCIDALSTFFCWLADIPNDMISFIYSETFLYMSLVIVVSLLASLPFIIYFRRKSLQNSITGVGGLSRYNLFRRVSTGVQLFIAMLCIFCTLVLQKQIYTLRKGDLGFERENQAMMISYNFEEAAALREFLAGLPEVKEIIEPRQPLYPLRQTSRQIMSVEECPELDEDLIIRTMDVSEEFCDFYGLRLLEGRWMNEGDMWSGVIINETLAKTLGWTDALKKEVWGRRVVGVVKDFLNESPTMPKQPYVLFPEVPMTEKEKGLSSTAFFTIFTYHEGTWSQVRKKVTEKCVKEQWRNANMPLDNVEEEYDRMLTSENNLQNLLNTITSVCILIALFGVWSMIMLTCEQRRKEIAVRKVFGATTKDILDMFFLEYMSLQGVAALVAFPVGYACMKPWVEQYVVQTSIPWWIYVGIFMAVALLVALCVGWRVWKTAKAHPADEIAKGRG